MRRGSEEAALMVIGRDRLGIEGIDIREVSILRVGGQSHTELLVGLEIPVELSVGGDSFRHAHVVRVGKGGRADSVVAVGQGLKQIQLATLDWAGKGQVRRSALHPVRAIVNPAEARDRVFEKPFPVVCSASSVDLNHSTGKLAVLG